MKKTFYLAQRRITRRCIKKYLMIFKEDVEKDFNISLPTEKQIELMPKNKFEELIDELTPIIEGKKELDIELDELLELYHLINRKIEKLGDEELKIE